MVLFLFWIMPGGAVIKNPPKQWGHRFGSGRFPGRRKWQPNPVFSPGNCMDTGAWKSTVQGSQNQTQTEHTHTHTVHNSQIWIWRGFHPADKYIPLHSPFTAGFICLVRLLSSLLSTASQDLLIPLILPSYICLLVGHVKGFSIIFWYAVHE